jgi:hypothetical protein
MSLRRTLLAATLALPLIACSSAPPLPEDIPVPPGYARTDEGDTKNRDGVPVYVFTAQEQPRLAADLAEFYRGSLPAAGWGEINHVEAQAMILAAKQGANLTVLMGVREDPSDFPRETIYVEHQRRE